MTGALLLVSASSARARKDMGSFRAIYGEDNRIDPDHYYSEKIRELSSAVAIIAREKHFIEHEDGSWTFSKPLAGGDCSAFMISHDTAITAGHCFEYDSCDESYLVFNYELSGKTRSIKPMQRYKCSSIESINIPVISPFQTYESFDSMDYAVFKVTGSPGSVRGSIPLESETVKMGTPLIMIGHPSGGPKKIADSCKVWWLGNELFGHDCDAFHGNSGSVILNASSLRVVGILVMGLSDYDPNTGEASVYTPDTQRTHEKATKINMLPESLFEEF